MSAETTASLADQQRKIIARLQEEYLESPTTLEGMADLTNRLSVAISDLSILSEIGE